MANLQEKISSLFPMVKIEEADTLTLTLEPAQLHDVCKTLRDDSELAFDYLETIVEIGRAHV